MTNTKELILAKLDEINDLLTSATCDGLPIAAADDCDTVWQELTNAIAQAEQKIDYYLD
jgi:hypothetical protein